MLGNDGDPDGDPIVVHSAVDGTGVSVTAGTAFTTANGGTVTLNADGTFSYTPAPGFIGEDSFDYSIADLHGETDNATVTINVQPDATPGVNDAPDANDDASITQKNTPSTGNALTNDTDPQNDSLAVSEIDGVAVVAGTPTLITLASGSTLEVNSDGTYTYTPAEDFVGTETLSYQIDDQNGGTDTATIYLSVFDSPPEVEDDINNTVVDTPVSGNVLSNDNGGDPDDDVSVGDGSGNPLTAPLTLTTDQGGTVVINADGTYEYTPPVGFSGEDSVEIEVCDEGGNCATQTLTIDVRDLTIDPNNAAPIASDDSFDAVSDPTAPATLSSNVLGNDADPDGDTISVVSADGTATGTAFVTSNGGTVTLNADGSFDYTPAPGFIGEDSFDYLITDVGGQTDDATVTINVQPDTTPGVNDAPDANDDLAISQPNASVMGNALTNDIDPNGSTVVVTTIDGLPVTGATTVDTPNGGLLTIEPNGDFTYVPASGYVGTETVIYTITDPEGETDTATIYLSVFDGPPIIEDDINNTTVNTPVDGNLLTNDRDDVPGQPLTIGDGNGAPITVATTFTTDQGGQVVIEPDGTYTYTPPADFVGEDTITLEVCDPVGNCEPNTLVIDVVDPTLDPNNAPPIAGDDHFGAVADPTAPATLSSALLGNDGDPDGDVLNIVEAGGVPVGTPFTTANGGTVTVLADGSFDYTPAPGFTGEDSFDYSVEDASGASDTATVTIDVQTDANPAENDVPDANDDAAVTTKNTVTTGDVLVNDTDPEGSPLSVTEVNGAPVGSPVSTPSGGTLILAADGTYTYTPGDDFVGTETVTYTIDDGEGGTDTATIYLSVFDTPPNVEDDVNNTSANTPVSGNVLTNDDGGDPNDEVTVGDGSGNPLTAPVTLTTDQGGELVIAPDGTYTYTPPADFVGEDTITIEVCDEGGNCVNETLSIDVVDPGVSADNTAPIAANDNFEVVSDDLAPTTLSSSLFGNDSDPDGDIISVLNAVDSLGAIVPPGTAFTTAAGGTVTVNADGTFSYTPAAGFIGQDSFEYAITDPSGATDTAEVSFNVQPDANPGVNDAPDANDDSVTTGKNAPVTGSALGNDVDPNGETLVVTEVNGAPLAGPITTANGGTLEIAADGSYTYTPADDFVGTDSVSYTISDGLGGTDTATIYLGIFDAPPQLEDDINNTSVNTPVDGNVLTNDSSEPGDDLSVADGNGAPLTEPTQFTTSAGGTLLINPDGTYTYTPPTDFVGEDSITLEICDEGGNCGETELSIEVVDTSVDPLNTPPIAENDAFEALSDPVSPVTLSSNVLGNDGDPDGDPIVVSEAGGVAAGTAFTTANGGTVTVNPDGTFDYTPAPGFIGVDSFDYVVEDLNGETDTATVTINVQPDGNPLENNAPDANDDAAITQKNTATSGNLLDNDIDINGDTLSVTTVSGLPIVSQITTPNGGTLNVSADGAYVYTPADDFVGTETVTYTIVDGNGGTDTATLLLSVFDSPPNVEDDINNTSTNLPVSGNVLTNDDGGDPDDDVAVGDGSGNPLTGPVTLTTERGGTLVIEPNGDYTYTPPADFVGSDSIELEICDEGGNCVTETLSIDVEDSSVNPTNTPPIAEDDNFSTFSDATAPVALSSMLLGNDGDPDADPITIVSAGGLPPGTPFTTANGGTVLVNADGTFNYTPAAGFIGADSFSYVIADTSFATDDALVTIQVRPDTTPFSNDAPDANDDAAITPLNTPISGNVTTNDVDPNSDPLTVVSINDQAVVGPTTVPTANGGSLTILPDGTFSYTPAPGFVGTELLTYQIADGLGGFDTATLLLSVFDTPPEVENDINNTVIDTPVAGNVLTNDNGGDPGDIVVVGDGEGNAITEPLTLTTSQGGTVVIQPNGDYLFTPAPGFVGEDVVEIEVCDGGGNCQTQTLSIEVSNPTENPQNIAVIAEDDFFETFSDPTNPGVLTSNVLGNDGDPDGDPISVESAGGVPAGTPFTTENGGTVVINPDGTFEYTPAPGFTGIDSFEYTLVDSSGSTDSANVSISVQPDPNPALNDRPDANDDAGLTNKNTPVDGNVLSNDTDINGDPLTVTSVNGAPLTGPTTITTASGGMLTIAPDGTYSYTPADDFVGNEVITYEISDGEGGTDTATLYLGVLDSAPIVEDDINTVSANSSTSGNVLTNDRGGNPNDDVQVGDGSGNPLTGPLTLTTAQGGTLVIQPNGDYIYTPAMNFAGEDTVVIEVCDEGGNCVTQTLTVDVVDTLNDPTNTGPIAQNDYFEAFSDDTDPATIRSTVTNNDGDADVDPTGALPLVTSAGGVDAGTPFVTENGGQVIVNPDGTFEYTPAPGFTGFDSFEYTLTDPLGVSDTATVTFSVFPDPDPAANDAPDANDDAAITSPDRPVSGNVLENDVDLNGDVPTVTAVNGVPLNGSMSFPTDSGGTLVINTDGSYDYTPGPNFEGTEQVTYTIDDGMGGTDTATLYLVVERPDVGLDLLTLLPQKEQIPDADTDVPETSERDSENSVLNTVNDIASLDGIDQRAKPNLDSAALNDLLDDMEPAKGASSTFDPTGIENSDPDSFEGQFGIDTSVDDGVLTIKLSNSILGDNSDGFVEYQATLADGRSLPSWIRMTPDGAMLIEPPVDVEWVWVQITGVRADGVAVKRTVGIEAATGNIVQSGSIRSSGPTFTSALNEVVTDDNSQLAAVEQLFVSGG